MERYKKGSMVVQNKAGYNHIVLILFIGVLMGALDISIVGPAIPSIEKSMQVAPRLAGWIFSIYVLFNLVGISLFAKLSDKFGRRNIYILAILIFAIGSLFVSLAVDFRYLLIGRAVQGFGASGIFPVASAVVGDIFPPEKRGRVLGLIGAVFGIAFIIGPVLAGFVLHFFRWNTLFLINIPIAVFLIYGSIRILPNTKVESKSRIDWLGIFLLSALLGLFAFGLNRLDNKQKYAGALSVSVYPYLLIALLLLLAFLIFEKKHVNPVIKLTLFKNKQIRLIGLIAVGTGLLQSSFVFIPDYAIISFGVNFSRASFMLIPFVLATAIGSPIFGRLLDKIGSKYVILCGLILSSAGFFTLSKVENSVTYFYFSGVLIGLGLSVLAGSSLRYVMLNEVGKDQRATTQGIVTIFISLGQIMGSALIGVFIAIKNNSQGYQKAYLYLSILVLLLFILSFQLKNRFRELQTVKA
jgi:EmrB/QacA subfamily drug resistance transporter